MIDTRKRRVSIGTIGSWSKVVENASVYPALYVVQSSRTYSADSGGISGFHRILGASEEIVEGCAKYTLWTGINEDERSPARMVTQGRIDSKH